MGNFKGEGLICKIFSVGKRQSFEWNKEKKQNSHPHWKGVTS